MVFHFPLGSGKVFVFQWFLLNPMQLSASINLFGIETVPVQEVDKFGSLISTKNETAGKKWIIQPKFETPMLDFGDQSERPLRVASDTITMPANFASASVPRGMWHQFGIQPGVLSDSKYFWVS